ncbi:MAG: methionine biosynthesis protein MetW, partial [Smithellaceae bacterium]|nr:methionine biosynthesis protein MetW [Smithellaceae bacterium]
MKRDDVRIDHKIIYKIVDPGARVLDLGCGTGELIYLLARYKNAKVQGVELDDDAVYRCVKKGLSVFQTDIERGLSEYPDNSFDYVLLNQSMQEVRKVDLVIQDALRVGRKVVVGFPNFSHLSARCNLFFRGTAPVTDTLPGCWYDTPNVRFLSIKDFIAYTREKKIRVMEAHYLGKKKELFFMPNLFAHNAVFL